MIDAIVIKESVDSTIAFDDLTAAVCFPLPGA